MGIRLYVVHEERPDAFLPKKWSFFFMIGVDNFNHQFYNVKSSSGQVNRTRL